LLRRRKDNRGAQHPVYCIFIMFYIDHNKCVMSLLPTTMLLLPSSSRRRGKSSLLMLLLLATATTDATTAYTTGAFSSTSPFSRQHNHRRRHSSAAAATIARPPLKFRSSLTHLYYSNEQDVEEQSFETPSRARHVPWKKQPAATTNHDENKVMGVKGEEPIASSSSSATTTSTTAARSSNNGGVNVDMVKTLGAYQLAVFAGVMACSLTAAHLGHWDSLLLSMQEEPQQLLSSLGPRFLEGIFLCGAPMVAFYREVVERSSARDGSHVNFSTTNLVMTVFGRRQQGDAETAGAPTTTTAQAIGWGALLALMTAWSEEFVFRGMMQSDIYHWSLGSAGTSADVGASIFLAWAMQSIVFGLAGHTLVNHHLMMLTSQMQQEGNNPAKQQQAANFKNIEPSHRMIMELQTAQAAWLGAVYFMTGGDLLPFIVGHFLYNM